MEELKNRTPAVPEACRVSTVSMPGTMRATYSRNVRHRSDNDEVGACVELVDVGRDGVVEGVVPEFGALSLKAAEADLVATKVTAYESLDCSRTRALGEGCNEERFQSDKVHSLDVLVVQSLSDTCSTLQSLGRKAKHHSQVRPLLRVASTLR